MKIPCLFRLVAIPVSLMGAVTAVGIALALAPVPAMADHHDHDDHLEARRLLQHGQILPLSRILQVVQQQVPGNVIEVELDHSHHHGWEYEVKVLAADGHVRKVKVNAGTGVVRKIEDD